MIESLTKLWLTQKEVEKAAAAARRATEVKILEFVKHDKTKKGTKSSKLPDGSKLSISQNMTRKVDSAKAQKIASENNIPSATLGEIFRWKPEVNAEAWAEAPDELIKLLEPAITTKPSSPSFSYKQKKETK